MQLNQRFLKYLDGKISGITVIKSGVETTYSEFGSDDSLKTELAKGDVISMTVLKDGETVSKVAKDAAPLAGYEDGIFGVSTTAPGYFYAQFATTGREHLDKFIFTDDATICKIEDNAVSSITLSDLKGLAYKKAVTASLTVAGGNKVDAIVVSSAAKTQAAWNTTLTDLAAGRAGTGYTAAIGGANSVTTTTLYDQMKAAKADLEIIRDDMAQDLTAVQFADGNGSEAGGVVGWGSDGDANANGNTIYATLSAELTRAAKYQIVSVKAVTGKLQTATSAVFADAATATAAAKLAMPTSIHATMADGSEKDIAVGMGTVTAGSTADCVCIADDAAAGVDATLNWVYTTATGLSVAAAGPAAFVLTPKAGTGTGAPIYVLSAGAYTAGTTGITFQ